MNQRLLFLTKLYKITAMKKSILLIVLLFPFVIFASLDQQNIRNRINEAPLNEKIPLLIQLGKSYTHSSQDSIIQIFHEAIDLAQASEDPKIIGDVFHEYGYIFYRLVKMDSALIYLKKAWKYVEIQNDSTKMGIILNLMGNVYWNLEEQITAKEHFERALGIHTRLNNDREIGRSYNHLGNVYKQWGEYEKAINSFIKASEYYEKVDYAEGLAWLNYSIALLYKTVQDYQNALSAINTSLDIYNQMTVGGTDSTGIMICYGLLGDLHRLMGDYDKGLHFHLEALRLRQKSGINSAIADGLLGVGQIYYETGEYQKSIEYMNRSKELREKSKVNFGLDTILKYLGFNYYKLGRVKEALTSLEKGLKIARLLNNLVSQKEILEKISQIHKDRGKYVLALEYYSQYDAIKDSLSHSELDRQSSVYNLQTEIREKQRENELLALDNKIHSLELERSGTLSNVLYLAIIFFIFIILVVIYLYRKKYKDNKILQDKNEQINKAHHLLENEIAERKNIENQREKLIGELQESLGKIKTLHGLIPICANCKKVRNDQGYYEQVEEYISEHTDAQFSHGICPSCAKEFYNMNTEEK